MAFVSYLRPAAILYRIQALVWRADQRDVPKQTSFSYAHFIKRPSGLPSAAYATPPKSSLDGTKLRFDNK
jgi:hypothetical protein